MMDDAIKPVKVIRAWADVVVTAWWEKGKQIDDGEWLCIRRFKAEQGGIVKDTTIRLSQPEAEALKNVIMRRSNE